MNLTGVLRNFWEIIEKFLRNEKMEISEKLSGNLPEPATVGK